MGDIQTACERLAEAVATIEGLEAKGWLDEKIDAPEAHVFTRTFDPRFTLGGSPARMVACGVRVYVKRGDLYEAQVQLRNFMDQAGPLSIREAVEDADNWPADTQDVTVTGIGQPFETTGGDAVYLAVDFDVDVIL